MDKVTEKTKGQVTFQSHWGASLAPPAGHIDLLEKGMVEVILGCRIYTPGKFPLGAFEYIFPFGPLDSHMVLQAKRQLYEEIPGFRDELAKANALLISNFSTMPYNICSKTPIQKLDDFKRETKRPHWAVFQQVGATHGRGSRGRPHDERYTLLQSKVTDMDFHPITHMNAFKVQEVAQFHSNQCHDRHSWVLMISLKAFNGLSPENQKS